MSDTAEVEELVPRRGSSSVIWDILYSVIIDFEALFESYPAFKLLESIPYQNLNY